MGQAGAAQPLTIALRGGVYAVLTPYALTVGDRAHPLSEFVGAAVIQSPPTQTGPAAPALGLRLRDGGMLTLVPVDPQDAWRLAQALYAYRPDLAPPPPPGASGQWGYPPRGVYGRPSSNETMLAGMSHLSAFLAPVIAPLIIWLVARDQMPYAARQAKQALVFHLATIALAIVLMIVATVLVFGAAASTSAVNAGATLAIMAGVIGYLLLALASVAETILAIYAAIQAFNGRPYSYPLLERL